MTATLHFIHRSCGFVGLIAVINLPLLLISLFELIESAVSWSFALSLLSIFIVNSFLWLVYKDSYDLISQLQKSQGSTEPKLQLDNGLFNSAIELINIQFREMARRDREALNAIAEVNYSAYELGSNAEQVAVNTQQQSQATSSTAAAVTQISQSIEGISAHIQHTHTTANSANVLSTDSIHSLQQTREEVMHVADMARNTANSIRDLEQRSNDVATMSSLVGDIAEQTNLLALNAAIEAARAGVHGQSFSVVADEVRALATRSHDTSVEISSNILTVQNKMKSVRENMDKVLNSMEGCVESTIHSEQALKQITEHTEAVSDQMNSIATVAEQQSYAARDISEHIENVARVAEGNSHMAKQTESVAHHIFKLTSQPSTVKEYAND